jgi:plastocyanin
MKIMAAAIMFLLLLLAFVLLFTAPLQQQAIALSLTGQQFFVNGTGIAYFDDGVTMPRFNHTITPDKGYYYDDSTVFYVGEIPGVSSANGATCRGNSTLGSSGNIHDITIINGISLLENKSQGIEPSPIVKIKAGDTVTWTNQDIAYHSLYSPPPEPGSEVYLFTVSTLLNSNGGTVSCTFTEPGGFHYGIQVDFSEWLAGTVIVEE